MNLQQLQQGLGDLYPPLRTRSGAQITAEQASGAVADDGLAVTVKTLFPPSNRRRTELRVSGGAGASGLGGFDVRPLEPGAMADAQRFAELLRDRWLREAPGEPLAPLRLVRDADGRYCWHVGPEATDAADPAAEPARTPTTDPATPLAKQASGRRAADKEQS